MFDENLKMRTLFWAQQLWSVNHYILPCDTIRGWYLKPIAAQRQMSGKPQREPLSPCILLRLRREIQPHISQGNRVQTSITPLLQKHFAQWFAVCITKYGRELRLTGKNSFLSTKLGSKVESASVLWLHSSSSPWSYEEQKLGLRLETVHFLPRSSSS